MADSPALRIPTRVRDWNELNRRCSDMSASVYQRLEELEATAAFWRGEWQSDVEYTRNSMVRDNDWLMIANTATSDRAAPQPDGDRRWTSEIPGTLPTPTIETFSADSVVYGNIYRWDTGGFIHGYRFYAPDSSGDFEYGLWGGTGSDVVQLLAPGVPGSTGWFEVPATDIWTPGEVFALIVYGRAVTQPSAFSSTWQTKNENSNPGEGEAIFRNNQAEVRVSNTDKGDVNRESQLASIEIGATMECGGLEWLVTNITTNGSGGGGRHNFFIEPSQGRPEENEQPISWAWGSTSPIPYAVVNGWYSGSPYPNGEIEGFIDETLSSTYNDNFYGVDVDIEGANVSPDWDWMAYSR